MFIKLYKVMNRIASTGEEYYLSEITVNVNQISYMSENTELNSLLREGKMNLDLKKGIGFTSIRLTSGNQISVVGTPAFIESKINTSNKELLRG